MHRQTSLTRPAGPDAPALRPARASLADLVTVANGVCGFLAISVLAGVWVVDPAPGLSQPELVACLALYAFGMLFDLIDGPIARKLGSSGYGVWLDAICDTITFGLLPALLLVVGLQSAAGWTVPALVVAAAYVAATIVRLARQSWIEVAQAGPDGTRGLGSPKPDFTGMPAPVGANCVLAVVVLGAAPAVSLAIVAVVAALLIGRFPYPNNKSPLGAMFVGALLALSFAAIAGAIPLAVPCVVALLGLLPIGLVRAARGVLGV